MFDDSAPLKLIEVQTWFAKAISTNEPSDGAKYLTPQSLPHIAIYREQYLLRLLKVLEQHYPFLLRLFGRFEFRQHATNYFLEKAPISWSLQLLGHDFSTYLEKNYLHKDRELILEAAILDWAWHEVALFATPKQLKTQGNLLGLRQKMVEHPLEYWGEHPFPQVTKGVFTHTLFQKENKVLFESTLNHLQ